MDLLTAETFICICIYKIQILYLINKQIVIMQLKNFKSVQSLVTKVLLAIIILLLNFHFAFTWLLIRKDQQNYCNARAVSFTIMLQLLNSSNKGTYNYYNLFAQNSSQIQIKNHLRATTIKKI